MGGAASDVALGALLAAEDVVSAGEWPILEAHKVGVRGALDLPLIVAIAARIASALESPVGQNAIEADRGEDIGIGAITALVGVEVGADRGIASTVIPNVEVDVEGRGGGNEAEEDLGKLHIERVRRLAV